MDRSEAKKKDQLPACPVETTLTLIGDKWKVLILRDLMPGTKRFSELRKSVGDVSQKVLAAQLRDMEKSGLVHREVYAEVPPRVEYRLTNEGKSLIGLLDMVYDWGWNDMKSKGLPIDALGEMWHGYREKDERIMYQPYYRTTEIGHTED